MSAPLESIVRPFADRDVFPAPFTKPGASGSQLVRVAIGFQGQIKTMGTSFSCTMTNKMGQAHREKKPSNSQGLKKRMGEAAKGAG